MFLLTDNNYLSGKADTPGVISYIIAMTYSISNESNNFEYGYLKSMVAAIPTGPSGPIAPIVPGDTNITLSTKAIENTNPITIKSITLTNTSSFEVTGVYIYLGFRNRGFVPLLNNITIPANATVVLNENGFSKYPEESQGLLIQGLPRIETCGENLNSHTPVVLVNNLIYKLDNTNPLHQFSFIGFTKTSALNGNLVDIETYKITLLGWGLIPNTNYLAGPAGTLITTNNVLGSFTKVIGYSETSETLLIYNNDTPINI